MTEPTEQGDVPEVGWRVLDPEGNVVDSGPGINLVAVSSTEPAPEED